MERSESRFMIRCVDDDISQHLVLADMHFFGKSWSFFSDKIGLFTLGTTVRAGADSRSAV